MFGRKGFGVVPLLILVLLVTSPVYAAAPAGQVIVAVGEVLAHKEGAAPRTLKRRSQFFEGEVIETAAGARAQLRFEDGAIMSLREDSALRIDEYQFANHGGAGDKAFMTLLKGGFRTITGAIGKSDPTAYKVSSEVATIGIRGTFYEARFQQGLSVAVWQGRVAVSNEHGQIELGQGRVFNYAFVPGPQRPPKGQLQPPPGIEPPGEDVAPAPEQQESDDAGDGDTGTPAGTDDSAAGADDESSEAEADSGAPGAVSEFASGEDSGGAVTTSGGSTTTTTGTSSPGDTTNTTTTTTTTTVAEVIDPIETFTPSYTDVRTSDAEKQRIETALAARQFGVLVETDPLVIPPDPMDPMEGGSVLGGVFAMGDDGQPFLAMWEDEHDGEPGPQYNGPPDFSGVPSEIIRRAGAADSTLSTNTSYSRTYVESMGVSWGEWSQSPAREVPEVYDDPTSNTVSFTEDNPLLWMRATASDPMQVANVSSASYNLVHMFNIEGSAGTATNFVLNANVNFQADSLSGSAAIYMPSERWTLTFADTYPDPATGVTQNIQIVHGNFIDLPVDPTQSHYQLPDGNGGWATVAGTEIEGGLGGFLIDKNGSAAGAIAGAFDLLAVQQSTSGDTPVANVQGIFVVGAGTPPVMNSTTNLNVSTTTTTTTTQPLVPIGQ